jgi:putative glutathione S-transferase
MDHIKRGYYSIKALNPTGIVPVGPDLPGLDPVALSNCQSGRTSSPALM